MAFVRRRRPVVALCPIEIRGFPIDRPRPRFQGQSQLVSLEGHPTHGSIHLFGNRLNGILLSERLEFSDILGTPARLAIFVRPPIPGFKSDESGKFL